MKFLIPIALLVVMPSFAQAAGRHHHGHQYVQEHRNAYVVGDIGIGRQFSTDRESLMLTPGN
jgi:hypothetical protein